MTSKRPTILVSGATGNVGRQVVSELLAAGASVRALARQPAGARLPPEVPWFRADLADPLSLAPALEGADALFLLWPFLDVSQAPPVLEAIARRTRRVVYLSAAGMFHGEMERLIQEAGLEWTFLRPTGFAANTLGWAEQIKREGTVRWPYGNARRSLIHERDIATVAARALLEPGHTGKSYLLTGPEALSHVEQAQLIGQAAGREVRYLEISREETRAQLIAAWGNALFVDAALEGWAAMVSRPEPVTGTVQELTGLPARSFAEWAHDHREEFR
jgi:uncharacterized protein YbjT (DUF2867 family)